MKYSLYKPTTYKDKNDPTSYAGSAISFNLWKTKDGPIIMLECVKQKSHDGKNGSFYNLKTNPEKGFRVKFNEKEAGGFVNAIRTYTDYDTFHNFDSNKTLIKLLSSVKKATKEGDKDKNVYTLNVTRNGSLSFRVGLELAEAEVIRVFFEEAIKEMLWAENKFEFKEEAAE